MNRIVIKVGGNVLMPRSTDKFDTDFILSLAAFSKALLLNDPQLQIIIVPGGAGGQFFLALGKEAGCSEAELNVFGCALIAMAAKVIARYMESTLGSGLPVCRIVPENLNELESSLKGNRLVVCACCVVGSVTSDSLAALIAEHTNARLKLVKRGVPFRDDESVDVRDRYQPLSLRHLLDLQAKNPQVERSGRYPSIDYLCLRVIQRAHLSASVVLKEDVVRAESEPLSEICIVHDF
jgi:uridylate kinase